MFLIGLIISFWEITLAIQINYLKVPSAVKNNSDIPAILDCSYSIRPDDTDLIIKWYLNQEIVYEWIPTKHPHSFGLLKNRLDLNHRSHNDQYMIYRGMKILNPTTDIAGEYKCFVSSFADEDFTSKNMIVYEPEKSIIIKKGWPNRGSVNFTCMVNDVYPEPKLYLYTEKRHNFNNSFNNEMQTLKWNIRKNPNGKYFASIIANALLEFLDAGALICCELRIPGTGYIKKKNLVYIPKDFEKNSGFYLKFNYIIWVVLYWIL